MAFSEQQLPAEQGALPLWPRMEVWYEQNEWYADLVEPALEALTTDPSTAWSDQMLESLKTYEVMKAEAKIASHWEQKRKEEFDKGARYRSDYQIWLAHEESRRGAEPNYGTVTPGYETIVVETLENGEVTSTEVISTPTPVPMDEGPELTTEDFEED